MAARRGSGTGGHVVCVAVLQALYTIPMKGPTRHARELYMTVEKGVHVHLRDRRGTVAARDICGTDETNAYGCVQAF